MIKPKEQEIINDLNLLNLHLFKNLIPLIIWVYDRGAARAGRV